MKKAFTYLCLVGLLVFNAHLLTAFKIPKSVVVPTEQPLVREPESELKKEAFKILKSKCNICHRKKNPFKIFSLRNMDRHASKIYKQVFVYRRMPKGDKIKLTEEEYQLLKTWLKSKNIY